MNKYEITTKKKKNTIIQTALVLFKERGFARVTIKEIAALAGVSQVSIYNYFGSKEALFMSCVDELLQDSIRSAEAILEMDMEFGEKIKMALTTCSSEFSIAFSNYFAEAARNDPATGEIFLERVNKKKREIYRKYIEYGKSEGRVAAELSTDRILDFMDALNEAGSREPADKSAADGTATLWHLLLYGLTGRP